MILLPDALLALAWCDCTPPDTPTIIGIIGIIGTSTEHQLDDVASASYVSRQGVAAALLHQSCPVAVRDCQVVAVTGGTTPLDVKCSEL